MLEMIRGVDEAFVIGETIVRVVEIDGDGVRLAISSPDAKPRYREVTLRRDAEEQFEFTLPQTIAAR